VCGLHNPEATLWERHKKDKKVFLSFEWGGRRIYGGAGRNSPIRKYQKC